MKREKVSGGLLNLANTLYRHPEPLGTVLVMGAWNYPFELTLSPVIAAMGSGNTVIIKPSEVSEASAKLMFDKVSF